MSVDQKNCIDSYTSIVKKKAERDFHTAPGKIYHAHQPIYGFLASEGVHTDPFDREQTARNFSVLKTLACLEFGSFLDVGSAEGFLAAVVRDIFKVEVIAVDLAGQAICNANRIFGLDGVSCNASRLPFQNDAFDVVHSSEVIEHLEHPFEFLVELARVARKFVILGTCEAADTHSAARLRQLLLPDVGQVGAHRSVWTPEDFFKVFGDSVVTSTQHKRISSKVRNSDPTEVFMAVCEDPPPAPQGVGVMALVSLDGAKKKDTARFPDVQLLQHLLSCKVEMTPMQLELAQMDYEKLLEVLRCPMCYGRLARQDQILTCKACNGCYPIINGVPELYLEQPMEMQELLCLSKVSDITNISRMDRWIRKREKEFASTMRIKNTRLRLLLDRLAKLIERLNQYSSLHEKIGYVVHKLFGRSWKSEDPSAGF